jgi:hypothetical protein
MGVELFKINWSNRVIRTQISQRVKESKSASICTSMCMYFIREIWFSGKYHPTSRGFETQFHKLLRLCAQQGVGRHATVLRHCARRVEWEPMVGFVHSSYSGIYPKTLVFCIYPQDQSLSSKMQKVTFYDKRITLSLKKAARRGMNRIYCLLIIVIALAYMFIYKQGEYLMLIHLTRACYINRNYFQQPLPLESKRSPLPKIYVPWPLNLTMIYKERYPGTPFLSDSSDDNILAPASEWLRVHHEYLGGTYLIHRLFHDHRLSTNDIAEADLCFPSCSTSQMGLEDVSFGGNILTLQVKEGSHQTCNAMTIGIEILMTQCSFSVPYWHSIYRPAGLISLSSKEPWRLNATRAKLLCYVGGVVRGIGRGKVIENLHANYNDGMFASHIFKPSSLHLHGDEWNTNALFKHAWEMYATSIFSLQPEGDTETRRGFYDAWMLGCIPVISKSAACTYGSLFGGRLFAAPRPSLEDIVVVLEDDVMPDGVGIMSHLMLISDDERARRRQSMAEIAPFMQWGWGGEEDDALLTALRLFMQSA